MNDLRRRSSLPDQLVKLISERISSGLYKRGDKLPSEQLMIEEFGVSRTVVREAIANLRAGGLISTQQGIGAFVMQQAPAEIFRIDMSGGLINDALAVLELRIAVEAEAAALAAQRRDDSHLASMKAAMATMASAVAANDDSIEADISFHRSIALGTGNEHFLSLFNYLGEVIIPRTKLQTFKLAGATKKEYLDNVNREHSQIYSAVQMQDQEAARAAMRVHLIGSKERLAAGRR